MIDGQQRLRTLSTGKDFALRGVQRQFENLTYKTLTEEDVRRLDDSIIHATIVNQDEPSDDDSSIYHIFQRLNTGGTLLKPQKIRSCIYHGDFNDLLKQMNNNSSWRAIFGAIDKSMRDEELIIRFLSLYFESDNYKKPMKEFLNTFMGKNRHLNLYSQDKIKQIFEPTIALIYKCLNNKAFKPKRGMNAAIFDAVMIGIARRLNNVAIQDCESLQVEYQALLRNENFRAVTVSTARTTEEENIKRRIEIVTNAFANLA